MGFKKTGIFLLCILLSISFVGCNNNNQDKENSIDSESSATNTDYTGNIVISTQDASGVFTRTTSRNFSSTTLSDQQLDELIKAGFASATGGNQRAWEFYVVSNRDIMKKIQTAHPYAEALNTAPVVIVIVGNEEVARYKDLLEMDAGIATQSIMVTAAELGLSSVAMSISPQEERVSAVKEALELSDSEVPIIMIAIGYSASDADTSASVNYYDESKVHYIE